jgi:hypothetical protein
LRECERTPRTARGPPSKVGCRRWHDAQLSLHLLQPHAVTLQPHLRREFSAFRSIRIEPARGATAAHVRLLRAQVTRTPRARLLSPDRLLRVNPSYVQPLRTLNLSLSLPRPRRARQRLRLPRSALSATVRLVRHGRKRAAPCGCLCCALPFAGSSGCTEAGPAREGAVSCERRGAGSWHGESQRKCVARIRGAAVRPPPLHQRPGCGGHPARATARV